MNGFYGFDELFAILETADFEYEGSLELVQARWSGTDVEVHVKVIPGNVNRCAQSWRIQATCTCSHDISGMGGSTLEACTEHSLLLPYNEDWQELYFRGNCPDTLCLIGELWHEHFQHVGQWLPFHRFLNNADALANILRSSSGLLAHGPATLVQHYSKVIERHQLRPQLTSPAVGRWWDGERWIDSTRDFRLLIADTWHIIAKVFSATKA